MFLGVNSRKNIISTEYFVVQILVNIISENCCKCFFVPIVVKFLDMNCCNHSGKFLITTVYTMCT